MENFKPREKKSMWPVFVVFLRHGNDYINWLMILKPEHEPNPHGALLASSRFGYETSNWMVWRLMSWAQAVTHKYI